jgi:hypothetical protein
VESLRFASRLKEAFEVQFKVTFRDIQIEIELIEEARILARTKYSPLDFSDLQTSLDFAEGPLP